MTTKRTTTTDDSGAATGRAPKRRARAEDLVPEVKRLHGEGLGRNEIARQLGASAASVTKAARLARVTFDVEVTRQATEVVVLRGKALRHEASERLLQVSLDKLEIVAKIDEHHLEGVRDARDMTGALRDAATAIGIAIDKSVKLEELERPAESMSAVDEFTAYMLGEKAADDDGEDVDDMPTVDLDDD